MGPTSFLDFNRLNPEFDWHRICCVNFSGIELEKKDRKRAVHRCLSRHELTFQFVLIMLQLLETEI